jgi:hypothetical protein
VEGCPADWETLPIPDGPITVGIDGGYVRNWEEKQQHFEVIVGKSILAFRRNDEEDIASSKCFGFVQTLDEKPKRRLFEVLKSQGHQMNQQLTFLSDGGDTVRDLQLYLNPHAEHLLDWFHLAMRLTVMQQTAKGLPQTIQDEEETYTLRDLVIRSLERLKWSLWHGNVYKAFQKITDLAMDLDVAVATTDDATARKLLRAVEEFHTYIERYRHGERISTGFVESTVNQVISKRFCKKQQMQWTKRRRICSCKPESKRSIRNSGRCSNAGIRISSWRKSPWRRDPQLFDGLLLHDPTPGALPRSWGRLF